MNNTSTKKQITLFAILFVTVTAVATAAIIQEQAQASGKDFGQCNAKFNKEHKGGGKAKSDARKAACGGLKPKGNDTAGD
jgi:hypothetical protein